MNSSLKDRTLVVYSALFSFKENIYMSFTICYLAKCRMNYSVCSFLNYYHKIRRWQRIFKQNCCICRRIERFRMKYFKQKTFKTTFNIILHRTVPSSIKDLLLIYIQDKQNNIPSGYTYLPI